MSRQETYPNPETPARLYDTVTDICLNAEDRGIDRGRIQEVLADVRREQFGEDRQ